LKVKGFGFRWFRVEGLDGTSAMLCSLATVYLTYLRKPPSP
jgi:hypothetical protein